MCHHSLPGIVTPIRKKEGLQSLLAVDFVLILFLYILISVTGVFAVPGDLQALHSLNFFHPGSEVILIIIGAYLALFPVIALSSNFPIITITLRDNLKALLKAIFMRENDFPFVLNRLLFPLLALLPPVTLAYITQQDSLLVSITGSFPGVGVQYLIPVSLAFMARYTMKKTFGSYNNPHQSWFSRNIYGFPLFHGLVAAWSFITVILIIVVTILRPPKLAEHPV